MSPSRIRCEDSESVVVHFESEAGTGPETWKPDLKQTNKQETLGQHPNTDFTGKICLMVKVSFPLVNGVDLIYPVLSSLSRVSFNIDH